MMEKGRTTQEQKQQMTRQTGQKASEFHPIGEIYGQIVTEYLKVAGVSLTKANGAIDDLKGFLRQKYGRETLEELEEILGIRPYIEAALSAMDDEVVNFAIDCKHPTCRVPEDYLSHVLYGTPLQEIGLLEDMKQLSVDELTKIALAATRAVHQMMIADIAYQFILENPAAQVFALPFELAGTQHLHQIFSIVEPIFKGLGIDVYSVMLEKEYRDSAASVVSELLEKGRSGVRRILHNPKAKVSDDKALRQAILMSPTGNKKFDRLIHVDKRIMTDESRRRAMAERTLDGMIQQAIALTPELDIETPS